MGSRLGRRVVHFANLPIKLLMPTIPAGPRGGAPVAPPKIREIALKTIPSATKFEIKSVLESLYGFNVEEVRTLNMEGKKKKRGGILLARPDYKKAYVTLRTPLPVPTSLFPIPQIEEERRKALEQQQRGRKGKTVVVEEAEAKRHWMDEEDDVVEVGRDKWDKERRGRREKMELAKKRPAVKVQAGGTASRSRDDGGKNFPWSSMRFRR